MPKDPRLGLGGAPTRATTLPDSAEERKKFPVASGLMDYFPDALVAVAEVSYQGNEQHNPGQPIHWARGKSTDEADTMLRHFLERGSRDVDGLRHSAKMVWRALAYLQKEIEGEGKGSQSPPSFAQWLEGIDPSHIKACGTGPLRVKCTYWSAYLAIYPSARDPR